MSGRQWWATQRRVQASRVKARKSQPPAISMQVKSLCQTQRSEIASPARKIEETLKGFRTTALVLFATLLDGNVHPSEAIPELYARRWRVEIFFDDLKTTLQMDRLRTKSPVMVQRELLLT